MALENHRTGLFDTLALPRVHEAYREIVFHQLYERVMSVYQSVCWASSEAAMNPTQHSGIVVFPGEEKFLAERFGITLPYSNRTGVNCTHRKVERLTHTSGSTEAPDVRLQDVHYCKLDLKTRPLLCRTFPFRIARVPGNNRSLSIQCETAGLRSLVARRGQRTMDQILHDVSQMAISLWAFLSDSWWAYYEASFAEHWRYSEVVRCAFTLTDDVVISNIKNAPPAWRAEILAQIAQPQCPVCEGSGIEFMDRTMDGKHMIAVANRRFDLCRTCVLPELGMRFGDTLIDPSSGRILDETGTAYRGDTLGREDRRKT